MIIINGRFLLHRVTGVERFAGELIAGLDEFAKNGELELAVPPGVAQEVLPVYHNIRVVQVGKLRDRLWEHISFPIYVKKRKAVSLNLCNTAPLPSPGIVCICDAKTRARPEFFSWKFLLWYKFLMWNETRRAIHILTISEFSKKELCRYYSVTPDRISVIPCAWQHFQRVQPDKNALSRYGLKEGQYYFAMSSLEPNKNIDWIRRAAEKNPAYVFAVAGKMNPEVFAAEGAGAAKTVGIRKRQVSERERIAEAAHSSARNVRLLGYVSDGAAKELISRSSGFLYPSFYEGFGIPPLEALSAGANPVFVSDTEVMHEVFEDAVRYVNPLGRGEELVLGQPAEEAIVRKVLGKYSWRESARRLYKFLVKYVRSARGGRNNDE